MLVSASISQGVCYDLINQLLDENSPHDLIISKVVLKELERKLKNRFKFSPENIQTTIELFSEQRVYPHPMTLPPISVRDPDDVLILASALETKSDILVTGDNDLLELKESVGIKIIDPRAMFEILEKER